MRAVKAGTKGGPHGNASVCRSIGDFGFSVFHRPGRCYRPAASSLSRVRDGSIPTGDQVVEQSLFDQIGFVCERPDFDLAAAHSGATTHSAQPSAGIVFRF